MSTYPHGNEVTVYGEFKAGGVFVDPSTVTLKARDPDGVLHTYSYPSDGEVVKDATGHFHIDLDTSVAGAGMWSYHWSCAGGYKGSGDRGEFHTRVTGF